MDNSKITIIINGNTYNLSAVDINGIGAVKPEDRSELISLLTSVKQYEQASKEKVQRVSSRLEAQMQQGEAVKGNLRTNENGMNSDFTAHLSAENPIVQDRLSGTEVDKLMARLVLEEDRGKKPALTKNAVYKFIGAIAVATIILIIVF